MNILELITDLDNKGLFLSVDTSGQLLATGPADALTDEVKTLLRQHKPELISHLQFLATVPIIGPGPVVQAGPVQVVVYPTMLQLFSPYNTDFVDDIKTVVVGRNKYFDKLMGCWVIDPLYTRGLADVIFAHYGIDTQLAIEALQGAS